ncbi:P1 family peptidase [Emcibacteraceae bacterium]|uniref:P1 family peptidase n=1 Tax=Pseudemcibacter sp. TaxID=2943293 RepID=UPI00230E9737|nr:P1 family peptidase [Emcibacteraceae bacterium]MDA9769771.1 P1 family peptidase [Emcibacteraceae bacterium]
MLRSVIPSILFIGALILPADAEQVRSRDIGLKPGILNTGDLNAITDVEGVLVGHVTLDLGDSVRTGATAILPHGGNIYQNKVPAAAVIGNGFGKMMGYTQIHELGEIETPILLTNTLNVSRAADAILDWTLAQEGNEAVRSVNNVVGETNDAGLNDIRGRHLTADIIIKAIEGAKSGSVEEGDVGAGKGTSAFGWKGGIGTSSRVLPDELGGYTVGVLVQSNYGGILMMDGVPVGEELNQFYLQDYVDSDVADGSIMMIVATDAPLSDRNLERLGNRAMTGLARTGSSMTNGSGDYVISFSTAESVRRTSDRRNENAQIEEIPNNRVSPLFQAAAEATEEAIYNSLLMARSVTSKNVITGETKTVHELPVDKVRAILKKYGR